MRYLWLLLILIPVVLVVVFLSSIVADFSTLWDAAWWAPAVILIVPAFGLLMFLFERPWNHS
jgi:hypothetical protein